MAVAPDGGMTPFLEFQEETSGPMSTVGRDRVVLLLGAKPRKVLVLVSIGDGRIVRRFDNIQGTIQSVAGAPDGQNIFYVVDNVIWAIPADGGTPRKIGTGNYLAVEPDGRRLVATRLETGGTRLVRIPVGGGKEENIPIRGDIQIVDAIFPNAVGLDGRIVVRAAPKDSWFYPAALLGLRTGLVERVWPEIEADMMGTWMPDGRVVAIANHTYSNLWRFTPVK